MGLGRLFLVLAISIFSAQSFASTYCPDANFWRLNRPKDVVKNLVETDDLKTLNFDNLKILVWNTYKAGKNGFYSDLYHLTTDIDLAILQEGYLTKTFQNLFCSRQNLNWKMATSFKDSSNIETGVVTASSQNPEEFFALKSPNTEPVTNTPKMALVTQYKIPESSETLMVINIHGINFVPFAHYKNQINQIAKVIKDHTGPVIFAGDFNSHIEERVIYLKKVLLPLGLEHAKVSGNEFNGLFVLDHLFYRGFEVKKAETLKYVTTSDHKPIYFELALIK